MPNYRITNYQSLDRAQKKEVVDLLSGEHVHKDEGPADQHYAVCPGDRLTVLLKEKNGKTQPLAAISTEDKHVFHWAGKPDLDFVKEHGHTPAEELMRQHIARQPDGRITFAYAIGGYPANALGKRLLEVGGGSIKREGDTRTITIAKEFLKKMKPALASERAVWETPVK
jgi:hypothetical protein